MYILINNVILYSPSNLGLISGISTIVFALMMGIFIYVVEGKGGDMAMFSGIFIFFFGIMFLYLKEPNNANIFLVIRYFCDILDGAVARKYNKTSKLGGYLDTIDDIMLITLYSGFIIWKKTENIKYTGIGSIVILLVLICYFKSEDSLSDHKNLKKDSNNIFKKLVKFIVDNSILVYIIMYYVNIKYLV